MRWTVVVMTLALAATSVAAQDADRSVKDGGIKVSGWKGRVDRRPASQGRTLADSRLVAEGAGVRLSVGPAGNFWRDADVARGNYEVKATFKEHKMAAAHPHSYGIFIGGAGLRAGGGTLMSFISYGNGTYSAQNLPGAHRSTLVDRAASDALQKADANGEATNEIGWRVKDGKASCVINGTEVKTFDRSEVIAADKLKSLDGGYGIRVSHNLELSVSALRVTKL